MLVSSRMPTQLLAPLPQQDSGRKEYEKLMGGDGDREIAYPVTVMGQTALTWEKLVQFVASLSNLNNVK